jgi:hypothetical protein
VPRDDQRIEDGEDAAMPRPLARVPSIPRRKNRVLALALASVAVLALVTAVTVTILIHYVEVHHLLAAL